MISSPEAPVKTRDLKSRMQLAREARQAERRRRERFKLAKNTGAGYTRALQKIGKHVGDIIHTFAPRGIVEDPSALNLALQRYAELLGPWARAISTRMVAEINQRDVKAWTALGREMGHEIRKEVSYAPTGAVMRQRLDEQVALIQSIPVKAAQRVHKLTIEALSDGTRADSVAREIMRSSQVTKSRATLIARTEIARTGAILTQSRAEFAGSDAYIWRTAEDSDVREIHRKHNRKVFKWSEPPVSGESGERAHPGEIYNCRCWAQPIFTD